jgi:flavin reductase (DIM6/NTAB) family NADH-FMN oxidoreductase RutF
MSTHSQISPSILYWGTPVVLISTQNEDGTTNIGPMSSAWWLGHNCMLGLQAESCTTQNLLRTGECVLNLADDSMAANINPIAKTTGSDPVPAGKVGRDYVHVKDKFGKANLTPLPSDIVSPPGIKECPAVMEAKLVAAHRFLGGQPYEGVILAIEVEILRVKVHNELRMEGHPNRINAEKWKPMIMMFCDFFGLRDGKVTHSRLAEIEEEKYRLPGGHSKYETNLDFSNGSI